MFRYLTSQQSILKTTGKISNEGRDKLKNEANKIEKRELKEDMRKEFKNKDEEE